MSEARPKSLIFKTSQPCVGGFVVGHGRWFCQALPRAALRALRERREEREDKHMCVSTLDLSPSFIETISKVRALTVLVPARP